MAIMRKPITLNIPPHLVSDARLYAPGRADLDAVCHVLEDYPRLAGEVRQLRRRVADFDAEGAELDDLLVQLKRISAQILEL